MGVGEFVLMDHMARHPKLLEGDMSSTVRGEEEDVPVVEPHDDEEGNDAVANQQITDWGFKQDQDEDQDRMLDGGTREKPLKVTRNEVGESEEILTLAIRRCTMQEMQVRYKQWSKAPPAR